MLPALTTELHSTHQELISKKSINVILIFPDVFDWDSKSNLCTESAENNPVTYLRASLRLRLA